MKFNLFTISFDSKDRWSFSILEFQTKETKKVTKYPTALFHLEWKKNKLYWELIYGNYMSKWF